jgi:hypothetical protein
LYGNHNGGDTNGGGIVAIDGFWESGAAPDDQRVVEFRSGWSTKLAYIMGDGSFYANGNIVAADTVKTNMLTTEGSVGIGTDSPEYKLDVVGNLQIGNSTSSDYFTYVYNSYRKFNYGVDGYDFVVQDNTDSETWLRIDGNNDWLELGDGSLHVTSTGYVGIGTDSPEYKLDVTGTIRADEILVEDIAASSLSLDGNLAANTITVKANGNTADFVFSDDYQLKDLSEVENFILTHNHLPDIPSATQMKEQGVNLAEMNKLLLQKVEELTLYAIEKDKEVESQKKIVEGQKLKIERIEEAWEKAREKFECKLEQQDKVVETLQERLAKIELLLINDK